MFTTAVQKLSPLFVALVLYAGLVLFFWHTSLALTQGNFTYALDDAYIHLAMAKQLAMHHIWGVSSVGFSGVSSSLLWTALLAILFSIFGNLAIAPFVLNIIFDILLLWILNRLWYKIELSVPWRLCLLLLVFIIIPFASLPMIGMEVSLQCLLVVAFLYAIILWSDEKNRNKEVLTLILAFLLGAVRYECILIVEIAAIGFLFRGEMKKGFAMAFAGAMPAVMYGIFAIHEGGTFLPNTLFLKSGAVEAVMQKIPIGWLPILLIVIAVVFILRMLILFAQFLNSHFPKWCPSATSIALCATVITAIAQFTISSPEQQFERYRAYVYIALIVWFGVLVRWILNRRNANSSKGLVIAAIVLTAAMAIAFAPRFILYYSKITIASKNIWNQQVQMARFVERYCNGTPVVLVDIGAVSYYTNSPVIDLIGLGTDRIALMRLRLGDPSESMNALIQKSNARLAMIYPILRYQPDSAWIKKGSLVIQDRYVCARDTVDFYALRLSDTAWLRSSLSDFRARTTSEVLIY